MPYRRKYRKRRRRRFRRRRGLTTRQAAFRALSRVDPEKKAIDVATQGNPVVVSITTPSIIGLNLLAEGPSNDDRIGKQAKMLSIQGRILSEVTAGDSYIRGFILLDRQPNGAFPTLANILANSTTDPFNSPMNLQSNKRLKILHTWVMRNDTQSFSQKAHHFYKKLHFTTRYTLTTAGINSIGTNSLLAVFVCNEAVLNAPTVQFHFRLRFVG